MQLEPIRPLEYITDRDPIPEEVMDSSAWFKTETIEVNVGEWSGRPTKEIMLRTSMLNYYFANGWYISEVLESKEGGKWIAAATAQASNSATATSSSSANSQTSATSESRPIRWTQSPSGDRTDVDYAGSSSSSGTSNTVGTSHSSGGSTSTVTSDGTPWWYAYQKLRLKRRKMQSELVLKDMIASFTKAYNEGRQINDERYDELVALYAIMLSRTEDEANAFGGLSAEDFKPLAKMVTDALKDALEKYSASVDNLPEDWMQSRIDEVNRKFDALVSQAKSKMVSEGTYNTTVWPTTVSGIERDRQLALNDLKDDMVTLRVEVMGKIATMTADVGTKLLDCEIRFIEAQQKMLLGPTEIRNTVFKWMLEFMERREDDYPGLEQIATIADKLGYAEGSYVGAEAK